MTENRELELYFHIPFCVKKCLYCDFLSQPASPPVQERYMEALAREALGRAEEAEGCKVVSVFFGGGTPSVVEARLICGLLQNLREVYGILPEAEITIEANPGTVDAEKLSAYREAGVNRLSIGLQSADDGELAVLGRIHTWQQFLETYYAARKAGFANINVDLMSALPGQTLESCRKTLESVLSLQPAPEHISAYSLIWEEGTPFYEMEKKGILSQAPEELDRQMYWETKRTLANAGYERYEISNYARAGYACRHNLGYWKRRDYLGFGVGAASLLENVRFRNADGLSRYLENPLGCREQAQALTLEEQMEEFLFLGLRMTDGVGFDDFADCFSHSLEEIYGPVIEKNLRQGLLRRCWRMDGAGRRQEMLALTEFGLDVANYVMAQFLR